MLNSPHALTDLFFNGKHFRVVFIKNIKIRIDLALPHITVLVIFEQFKKLIAQEEEGQQEKNR